MVKKRTRKNNVENRLGSLVHGINVKRNFFGLKIVVANRAV